MLLSDDAPSNRTKAAGQSRRARALTSESQSTLAPFRVRSFRFQWPADLATSWAFEMETLILSWYVLVETASVLLLTLFASLQYLGTLLAPMFGVVGHRIGNKRLLCAMRAIYAILATTLMTFAFLGALTPVHVFVIAALMGIVRPSDLVMRYALVGESMPPRLLVGATSVSRTTQDSARMLGALAGAGLVATLGMGPAYSVIAFLYGASFLLTLRVAGAAAASTPVLNKGAHSQPPSAWHDLREAAAHVRDKPQLLSAIYIAILVNLTAFPLVNGLLPYVAKEVYGTDQTGLSYMVAGFALGALLGSIALSRYSSSVRAGRMIIVFCLAWYAMTLLFAHMETHSGGILVLVLAGFAQSLGMVSMSAMLLRNSADRLRGRIMGLRMLAIYGVPVGLLVSGPLIGRFGYPATATAYSAIGLSVTLLIAVRWREHLWNLDAPANLR